ncbi:MAG: ABC transporter ATP-binding protein [Vitreoscilla sp.]|nr:ABC transporter ATP-binding protein [Vitreoscilla sp.]
MIIALDDVQRSYALAGGTAHRALRGVTLRVEAGEQVAVLGKSGSGKSTLLNLVAGLDRADGGRVQVAGTDLGSLSEDAMARWRGRQVGVVFQFFQLLPTLTVAENLQIAMDLVGQVPRAERPRRALALLDRVDVADQASKLPAMLSGGQQQRVAIARALANDPPLLLADEPTGNLDTETAAAVTELFSSLAREGKTLLLVTHDDTLARASQRVIRLRDGEIVSDERVTTAAAA